MFLYHSSSRLQFFFFAKCQCHVRFNDTNAMNRFRHRNCKFMCFPFGTDKRRHCVHRCFMYVHHPENGARTRKNICLPVWLFCCYCLTRILNIHSHCVCHFEFEQLTQTHTPWEKERDRVARYCDFSSYVQTIHLLLKFIAQIARSSIIINVA